MAALLLPLTPGENIAEEVKKHVWNPDTGPSLPASLLSRLTEAADGCRKGEKTWLVAEMKRRYKMGHKISGHYGSAQEAHDADPKLFDADPLKDKYKIFGPFLTTEEFGEKENKITQVVLMLKDGRQVCLDGAKYDCVFWSLSAFDKFVVPYYVQITNLEEAEEIRDEFVKNSDIVAGTHIPGSEIIGTATTASGCPKEEQPEGSDGLWLHLIEVKEGLQKRAILLSI